MVLLAGKSMFSSSTKVLGCSIGIISNRSCCAGAVAYGFLE